MDDAPRPRPLLGELDLHLIAEGNHRDLSRCLGAHAMTLDGVAGVRFAVWAPNARSVSVVGDFNHWDGRRHRMQNRREAGVWETFVPGVRPGAVYKYELHGPHGLLPLKADPVALQVEAPPRTASVVTDPAPFAWTDDAWMQRRAAGAGPVGAGHAGAGPVGAAPAAAAPAAAGPVGAGLVGAGHAREPLSIYELHAGSWRRRWDATRSEPGWDELGEQLIPYLVEHGFTHVELMPVTGHPFGGSWGYQPLSLFAPHAPWGDPAAFKRFVNRCHIANLGVILDWVPAHFPTDAHGLMRFDGTALYEHEDPREGFHQDWNTLIYNFGRNEVRGFLVASALHWLEHYHVDGLRVDAVASMLYRDYSRRPGEWIPNRYGGRENIEAIGFLRQLNDVIAERCPGVMTLAEESTAWPGVTAPTRDGGLGFTFKWNMGWMHDTLGYAGQDPVHRRWHHNEMTFGLVYAFSERFVLPLSHDEVVHGKRSLLCRMPGDRWQQFANLRAYYGFMWAHPGKKLLFMGGELAQVREWNHDGELDWPLLQDGLHRGVQRLVGDLNRCYRASRALHHGDCEAVGFHWIIGDDATNSVFAFLRLGADEDPPILTISNFTPVPRIGYRIGAPRAGRWREILNTDASAYGGSGVGNLGAVTTREVPSHGQPFSLELTLPPLATILLRHEP